jgi:hypothetical protein
MELNVRLRKSLPLLLIILAFASPMLMAHIALVFQDKIKQSTNAYGYLLPTVGQLQISKFEKLLNDNNANEQQWQIVFVKPENCEQDCLARQQALIQLHALLRDDKKRVNVISTRMADLHPHKEAGTTLLLDPQGNYIMYYEQTAEPSGILKDLMRLLKYSNV